MGQIIDLIKEIEELRLLANSIRDGIPADDLSSLNHILLMVLFKQILSDGEVMGQIHYGEGGHGQVKD